MTTKKIIWWRFLALLLTFIGLGLLLGQNPIKMVITIILISVLSWRYQISVRNKEALNGLITGLISGFFPLSVLLDGNAEAAAILSFILLTVFIVGNSARHATLRQTKNTIFVPNALISFFLVTGIGMEINAFLYTLLMVITGIILPYLIVSIGKMWREHRHYARLTRAIKRNHG